MTLSEQIKELEASWDTAYARYRKAVDQGNSTVGKWKQKMNDIDEQIHQLRLQKIREIKVK